MSEVDKMARVNWVKCPNCGFEYYVGPQLLLVDDIEAICPNCRTEFEAKKHLIPVLTGMNVNDRWY